VRRSAEVLAEVSRLQWRLESAEVLSCAEYLDEDVDAGLRRSAEVLSEMSRLQSRLGRRAARFAVPPTGNLELTFFDLLYFSG
jgi:hypothetical protein